MINSFDDILKLSGKKLSEEQLKAVFSDRATLVSAGAGSGKTTVLSLRFLRLVYQRKSSSDRILTLTYTRKAASEMYERIHNLLSLAAKNDESGYFQHELEECFPKAQISTMDGFWVEIARAGALGFGISRDFSLLSNEDSDEIIERCLETLSENPAVADGYMFLSSLLTPDRFLSLLSSIASHIDILTCYDSSAIMDMYRRYVGLLKEMAEKDSLDNIFSDLEELLGDADPGKSFYKEELGKAKLLFKEKRYGELPKFNLRSTVKSIDWDTVKLVVNSRYRIRIKDYIRIQQLENNEKDEGYVADFIGAFISLVQKERRAAAMLTFEDIARIAKETLIRNRGIREYYKRRFDYIMVDEFQDNNTKQKENIYLLSESLGSFSQGVPSAEGLDKNKLFFVGDDKQSIYRFRDADVSVFNAMKNEVVEKMNGDYLTLSYNFRSEPGLIDHFNKVFQEVFSGSKPAEDEMTEMEEKRGEDEEHLINEFRRQKAENYLAEPCSINAGKRKGPVTPVIELDTLPIAEWKKGEKPDSIADECDCEAEYIARKIEEIVSSERFNVGENRKAEYEDIAVLFGVTKSQMPIERALRRHNIPYTVTESTSVTVEGMSSDFYSFLQLVVYPNDRKSFLAVLRSPFVRLSDEGMLAFASCDSDVPFRAFSIRPEFSSNEDSVAYDNASKFYDRLKRAAESGTIASLIGMLFYDSGYYSYISSNSRLAVYKEHFDYLWALADNADSRGTGLPLFLDSLRPIIGSAKKLEDITIQALDSKGVSLMTIHKSKGLEFPIVILADSASRSSNKEKTNTIIDCEGEENFLLYDIGVDADEMDNKSKDSDAKKPLACFFNSYEQRRVEAERKRVLYVALTRAINHLIITASDYSFETQKGETGKRQSLYRLYKEALTSLKQNVPEGDGVSYDSIPYYSRDELGRSAAVSFDESWYSKAKSVKEAVYREESIGVKDAAASASLDTEYGSAEALPDFQPGVDRAVAGAGAEALYGTMLHASLEEVLGGKTAAVDTGRILSESDSNLLLKSASETASAFLKSGFYKKYIEGKMTEAEAAFYYPSADGTVMAGSADLVVFCEGYNLVVDYKSDRYRIPEIHREQLRAYAEAIESLYEKPCYSVICYLRDFSAGPVWDKDGNEAVLPI